MPNGSFSLFVSFIGIVTFTTFILFVHAEKFTAQEREILNTFRARVNKLDGVHDYQKIDSYLVRWLKDQNWDVENAASKFTVAQKWRKSERIDSILNETFPEFYSFSWDGVDFEGRPVVTNTLTSLRSLILLGKRELLLRYQIYNLEKAALRTRELAKSNGKDISQIASITDFQGFNTKDHACVTCLEVFTQSARTQANYYPNFIAYDVWINVPMSAKPVLSTFQYFSPPWVNLTVFGANRTEWSAYLQKNIPADQLTYRFGGTKP